MTPTEPQPEDGPQPGATVEEELESRQEERENRDHDRHVDDE